MSMASRRKRREILRQRTGRVDMTRPGMIRLTTISYQTRCKMTRAKNQVMRR